MTSRIPGSKGVALAYDRKGVRGAQPVVLLHGGGQTRSAWGATLSKLAARGYDVLSVDLRGHGDSDWCPDGDYSASAFRDDLRAVVATLDRPPVLVGASLGGHTALLACAEPPASSAAALVLVDIAPRTQRTGTQRILEFMRSAPQGFSTLQDAADAVARYLPHRPRRENSTGLARNLRRGIDGRLRWHWDPNILERAESEAAGREARLTAAARALTIPVLMVRGALSDVVSVEDAAHLRDLVPHLQTAEVAGARHMVAGDENDAFTAEILAFLEQMAAATR